LEWKNTGSGEAERRFRALDSWLIAAALKTSTFVDQVLVLIISLALREL